MFLAKRIPHEGLEDDDALEAVLDWIADRGLEPYPAQEEAIMELFGDQHVILATPTGSGKSLVAVALHALHLARRQRSVYTAPIKALVSEKFFDLCEVFGAERVGMMTGDASVNPEAPVLCCTAEVLEQMALRHDADTPFAGVVMDEFHYYGDRDRGRAWHVPLITMTGAQFLLMSATLGDTDAIGHAVQQRTGRPVVVVRSPTRPVPLTFHYSKIGALSTLGDLVRQGKAPVYAVHFTQRAATELAQGLLSSDPPTPDQKEALKAAVKGFRFDSPFGRHLRRMVLHGIGLHHAGLLPKYRMLVEKLAQQGLFRVICGTDTLGVGINVPIRTVLFTQLCKFDGEKVEILTVRDFQQIAGRAGRKGYDTEGTVVVQAPAWAIENQRVQALVRAGKKKKPKVKAKPPSRGYKHWDQTTFERLVSSRAEALTPQLPMTHGIVLARLRRAEDLGTDPFAELDGLIDHAHLRAGARDKLKAAARERVAELVRAGIVEEFHTDEGERYEVYEDLQEDFSVHHALSLFLVQLVSLLDRTDPDYALDVITCVESILEHPRVVLRAQLNREKGRMIGELKAAGVPYEERMERLEEVTWPKPRARWLYDHFEDWRSSRPWVSGDPVRPKSIVRELVEGQAVFSTYVGDLGIDRSEGVVLRYVSQVYKTLLQGVPDSAVTEPLDEAIGFLRAMLARVDDSLVTAWEAMIAPAEEPDAPPRPHDISADAKRFRARVRAELHAFVHALASGDLDEAAASVRSAPEVSTLRQSVAGFVDDFGPIGWDGRARQAWNTQLTPDGSHRWTVTQRLVAADHDVEPDDVTWAVQGVIDLRQDTNPSGPIIEVVDVCP